MGSIAESESSNAKIVLVGTQQDRREDASEVAKLKADKNAAPVTTEQGEATAKAIGAHGYVECSALLGDGLKECMQAAVNASLAKKAAQEQKKKGNGCVLL